MKRNEAREQAFVLLFGECFNEEATAAEIVENAAETGEYEDDEFTLRILNGVMENKEAIDKIIGEHLNKWKLSRIPKTNLAILRIAVFEMMYCEDIPDSVSINEAVELAKKYSDSSDYSFVNGILGNIERSAK